MQPEYAIRTVNLQRTYKTKERVLKALDGVDLAVRPGELFGFLGPNGAGKTTTIKILTTLLLPSGGTAEVWGFDVLHEADAVRRHINMVSGGESSGYGLLTVRENLWMFTQFHGMDSKVANKRIDELLEVMGLADRAKTRVSFLSTGLRQKMNYIRGLLTDPDVLFLDEPTLGLDVEAARTLRTYTRHWLDTNPGKTVVLTTHYMQEADELCDRVAIISGGTILACDTPTSLKYSLQQDVVFRLFTTPVEPAFLQAVEQIAGVQSISQRSGDQRDELSLILRDDAILPQVLSQLANHNAGLLSLEKRQPTLEDVFVNLVGHSLSESEATA
ncbi:ATP-binding cassette domain-containing protein [Herpetosiphon sp. NSE202]|uniref:ABC transporter ATP-binding protein n=1 Tax=Herpetosiphon sp. NSE202 TaxID=3351349 RepID=UPI003643C134